jgi:subtilisin family serine protease
MAAHVSTCRILAALLLAIGCALGGAGSTSARAQSCDPTGMPGVDRLIDNGAIVALNPGYTVQQVVNALNQQFPNLQAWASDQVPGRPIHLISFTPPPPWQMAQIEAWLAASPMLQYSDLLYAMEAPEGKTGSVWVDFGVSATTFHNQYLRQQVGLSQAHPRSQGLGSVVAVLDTGIDFSHPVLQGRMVPGGGYNFITNSTNTNDVGDGIDNDGDGLIDEMVGHGTYVAGLIILTAPQAKILPVVVLNPDGVGDLWGLTRGIYYAIDKGVEVINLSLGSTYDSDAVNAATEHAQSLGIITVAAAGNFNRNCPRERPAMDDDHGVLGVAAVNDVEVKANFSNFNKRLFISAPGDSTNSGPGSPNLQRSVISTIPVHLWGKEGGYRVWKGTSMGTPIVSGAAALVRAQHPEWPASLATFNNITQRLRTTAINIYSQNPQYAPDQELGAGRVNIAAAVALGPIAPKLGDLNNDGVVNVNDLLRVISDWGLVHTPADIDGDGIVNVNDLLIVIQNWG